MHRKSTVVDTNVAMVANGNAEQASPMCVQRAIEELVRVREGRVCIDSGFSILLEYLNSIGISGQPGVGHAFVKWVWDNQANPDRCEVVEIHENKHRSFDEFPDDIRLKKFDRNDRKFVAVAVASDYSPVILNAVDSDWWEFKEVLAIYGVRIKFVYPEQFQ